MAYYLELKAGVDDYMYAEFPNALVSPWALEIDTEIVSTSPYVHDIFSLFWEDSSEWVSIGHDGSSQWKILSNGRTPGNGSAYTEGTRANLKLTFDGTKLTFFKNGVEEYSVFPVAIDWLNKMSRLMVGIRPNDFTDESGLKLYSLAISEGGAVTHLFDPTLSEGTGLVIPDSKGNADATLHNMVDDDSQWVYYEAPTTQDSVPSPLKLLTSGIVMRPINRVVQKPVKTILRPIERGN